MDRGRRAEPYSNATIWTREIARNLASHLSRVSNAHSCVDTRSPKSTRLPQFHHPNTQKRCPSSPMKTRHPILTITRNPNLNGGQELDVSGGENAREEIEGDASSNHDSEIGQRTCNAKQEIVHGSRKDIPAVKPPAKKRAINGNVSDMTTYDSPQRHHVSHDYYKRQEQRKIWQENQALNKRLQSAKATLNFREWEKDGKWTQEFLKTQERRRHALQQELRRAQISPQAVLRSRPLKSLHHHVKKTALDSDKYVEFSCSLSARASGRRDSKGQILLGSRGGFEALAQHPSAANHRRIMILRQQKHSPRIYANPAKPLPSDIDAVSSAGQTAFIPDNEIVAVRFTFSRGRSRNTDPVTNGIEQSDQPEPLIIEGDRDTMSLSGAFSPGVELETELNAFAVNDSTDQPQGDLAFEGDADTGAGSNIAVEESECYQSDADFYNNNSQNDVAVLSAEDVAADADSSGETLDHVTRDEEAVSEKVESEIQALDHVTSPSPSPQVERTQSSSDEEEGDCDGDNFNEDALPPASATEWQHDKLEASGYASEFEDEAQGNIADASPANNLDSLVNAMSLDNQEEDDDDEEYSRDDFE
ncbi:hypothetical protein F442_06701 [Phytophthora nicotianae P10297]|uniref:Uncharacterized protein n=1 Tax=Phytophthora nicotianae P10297 TaxID=1317064 RepID=W2ZIX4_PHYNI|nr:hypothetical protein F442_06701 [Phytophthora nicotianae P10297]